MKRSLFSQLDDTLKEMEVLQIKLLFLGGMATFRTVGILSRLEALEERRQTLSRKLFEESH